MASVGAKRIAFVLAQATLFFFFSCITGHAAFRTVVESLGFRTDRMLKGTVQEMMTTIPLFVAVPTDRIADLVGVRCALSAAPTRLYLISAILDWQIFFCWDRFVWRPLAFIVAC